MWHAVVASRELYSRKTIGWYLKTNWVYCVGIFIYWLCQIETMCQLHLGIQFPNYNRFHSRGYHGSSWKQISQKLEKLRRQKGSQWQPVVCEGAVTPLLVCGVCRFKPRGPVYLCTKSGPNHTWYTNLTKWVTHCSKAEGETEMIVSLRKEEASAVSSPPDEKKRHSNFLRKSSAERRDERVTPLHLDLLRETEGRRRCCDTP